MSSYDDGLPDGAFTESERAAGVPRIMRGGARTRHSRAALSTVVTEQDCIALIIRSIVMQDVEQGFLRVRDPEDEDIGVDSDFGNFSGLSFSNVNESRVILSAYDQPIPARMLLYALRKTRLPLFMKPYGGRGLWPWLAWDDEERSLETNNWNKHRGFFIPFTEKECPKDPERARVFKLLRTWYLSSDHVSKPLLVHNRHLEDALAKRSVPLGDLSTGFYDDTEHFELFAEPDTPSCSEIAEFSLVYFTPSGEVTALPLSKACKERVAISTRAKSYFPSRGSSFHPSLVDNVLWANSFRICVEHSPVAFRYYLKRNSGTVFQSVFERVDIPPDMLFEYCNPDALADKARQMLKWASEHNAEIYLAVGGHPLEFNECQHVTTPQHYANAVRKLNEYGFRIRYRSLHGPIKSEAVDIHCNSNDILARSKAGPYAERWKPSTL